MDTSDRDDTVTRWYLAYAERLYTGLTRLLPNPEDRREYRNEHMVSDEFISNLRSPEFVMVREDESHRLARAVAALPRRDGEIVKLYYYRELSVREVSEVLRIPVGTVKFRLFRCRRTLAAVLEGICNET